MGGIDAIGLSFARRGDFSGYDATLAGLEAWPDLNQPTGRVRTEPSPSGGTTTRADITRMGPELGFDLAPGVTSSIPHLVGLGLDPGVAESFGPLLAEPTSAATGDGLSTRGRAGTSAHPGEIPPARPWPGQLTDVADGGGGALSLDIARINQVLQQLLDEVRKSRQPFLPLRGFGGEVDVSNKDYS
jgi:hypothetical protein